VPEEIFQKKSSSGLYGQGKISEADTWTFEIIFRVKKVVGKGKFQDGHQNRCCALSASLSRFKIELGE